MGTVMATVAKVTYAHITKNPKVCGGSACIDNTRIRVIDIVQAHREGHTAEQIQDLFALKLSLAQVYSALAYADENSAEIETAYAEHEQSFAEGEQARDEYLKRRSRS